LGRVEMSLPSCAVSEVKRSPVSCMPSPESPAKRITTRSSCWTCLSTVTGGRPPNTHGFCKQGKPTSPVGNLAVGSRICSVDDYLSSYLTIGLLALVGVLIVGGAFLANRLLRPGRPNPAAGKRDTYECGLDPVPGGWAQMHI